MDSEKISQLMIVWVESRWIYGAVITCNNNSHASAPFIILYYDYAFSLKEKIFSLIFL